MGTEVDLEENTEEFLFKLGHMQTCEVLWINSIQLCFPLQLSLWDDK